MSSSYIAIKVITNENKNYIAELDSGEVAIDVDVHDGIFEINEETFEKIANGSELFKKAYDWFFESLEDPECAHDEMEEAIRIYGSGNIAEIRSLKKKEISYTGIFSREEYWDEPNGASFVAYDYSTKTLDEEHHGDMDEEDGFGDNLYQRFLSEFKVDVKDEVHDSDVHMDTKVINIVSSVGDKITIKGITWTVIDTDGSKALLLADKTVGERPYNRKCEEVTWESCDLRSWLNEKFYKELSDAEKNIIVEVENDNPMNVETGVAGGNKTKDKIFVLSIDEVNKYLPNKSDRAIGDYWRLRTPGEEQRQALVMNKDGSMLGEDDWWVEFGFGIRPAMWIKLK